MNLKNKYKQETNKSPFVYNEKGEITSNFSYTDSYVIWLEDKLNKLTQQTPTQL